MNFKIILYITGFLLMLTGLFMLSSIGISIYYDSKDIKAFLISGTCTLALGFILWFIYRKEKGAEITKKEGYFIVTIGWLVMSLFGTLPFIIHGSIPNFTDAFFETMSGFTTTGASILNNVEALPSGLLFWRSMTHWIGGMGIIVLSIAILPFLGVGGMQLYQAEVAGPNKDKLHPRIQETAKRLWAIYVLFTMLETILLLFGGMNLLDALCHSFGSLATGGFSTKNQSVAFYNSAYIDYVIIIFMFIGGTSFSLHYFALHGKISSYFKDSEFRFYFGFILLTILFTTLFLIFNNSLPVELSFRNATFNILSILTSTGFAIADYESWAPFFSTFFLILLLFGACAGSTSGGVKMIRYQLLIKHSILELKRLVHPHAVLQVRHNEKSVPNDIIAKIASFVFLYLAIFGIGSFILSFLGLDTKSVAACMANIGPGLGSTGPVSNYSDVPDLGKWFLSFFMLLGRLELFTVLVLFSPSFWKK